MKKITTEEEYLKALVELEKLQVSKKPDTQKKLDQLYDVIEEWEKNIHGREASKLEALREEMAVYTEEEIKIFSVMALKLLEYKKNKEKGTKAEFPKFDPELYEEMKEWARLRAEIHTEEAKLTK